MYVRTYIHTYLYMYVRTYIHMKIHTCIHTYIYVHHVIPVSSPPVAPNTHPVLLGLTIQRLVLLVGCAILLIVALITEEVTVTTEVAT